jgi:hypothetical protein
MMMADRLELKLPARRITGNCLVLFTFFLILLLAVPPVSGTVFTYGNASAGSIQDLINRTVNGDSIYVAGGRYPGNLVINRSIVFGALDMNDPPEIVSENPQGAGIILSADGVTLNGIVISGNAEYGLLIQSSNNQIRALTVTGAVHGIGLKAAAGNSFSGNTIENNAVGIDIDRTSRSNTFSLNSLNNTLNVASQSADTLWSSGRQVYEFRGSDHTGQLGNFWSGYTGTDANGDGVGDSAYTVQDAVSGQAGGTAMTDRAPLTSLPASYTIVSAASPFNTSPSEGVLRPPEFSALQPQQNQPLSGGTFGPGESLAPAGDRNPLVILIIQYWWIIPIAILLSAAAGIWFERRWRVRSIGEGREESSSGSVTVVRKTLPVSPETGAGQIQYAAHLPPALERKYPDAEYIAEGGVSRVFRAWDGKESRHVAVKIPIRFDEVTGTQFTKELHVWEGLHHKNIVEIYAANIFPVPYIEMEYVKNALTDMRFPLMPDEAVKIIKGVAEGLRYAHDQGIVHRDIKPGNIMITPDGVPKISDWGLSKAEGTKQSGLIGFSLEYAAPEQLAPNMYGEPGPWTDIYQLGVLLYEMLSGYVPFQGGGMGEVTHAILHDEPLQFVPEGEDTALITAIISRCLAKNPQERYSSIGELLGDLERIGPRKKRG